MRTLAGPSASGGRTIRSGCPRRANGRPTIRPIPATAGFPGPTDAAAVSAGCARARVRERVLAGGTDEEVLAWARAHGTPRSDEEGHRRNRFRLKPGWRDERSPVMPHRILDAGLTGKPIETVIDPIEFAEAPDPMAATASGAGAPPQDHGPAQPRAWPGSERRAGHRQRIARHGAGGARRAQKENGSPAGLP